MKDVHNDLTNYINKLISELVNQKDYQNIYKKNSTNFTSNEWVITLQYLLDNNIIDTIPQELNKVIPDILRDLASGSLSKNNISIYTSITNKLDMNDFISALKDVRDIFCDNIDIDCLRFTFFEKFLREKADLKEKPRSVHKILKPIFGDPDCRNLILNDSNYYIDLVNNSDHEAAEFKTNIEE